jgi:hypothetical protein
MNEFLNKFYVGYNMGLNREMDINVKQKDFNKYVVQLKGL